MLDVLAAGCQLTVTDNEDEADVLLLNTCSVYVPRFCIKYAHERKGLY